ncbi:phosphoribosylaminoimidazolesuccinocarboxamide synthase [Candidatus Providencia siddallii]|uniref:Phosphoribosylaminoimidazole-succinocarboxamide synthase n=1 Tax=Candidatus Providencia siddallii TaxID=1715285 RepID=A0ABM9NNV9_9GAMM
MKKCVELYKGKSKTIYTTDNPDLLILRFRDEITAFDGKRIEKFFNKGYINNNINYFLMNELSKFSIFTQIEKILSKNEVLVKKLKMIPIEFVIRNRAAGSIVKRLDIIEGKIFNPPLFELFLKNDSKHDPMINESYCKTFNLVSKKNLVNIYKISKKINNILTEIFNSVGLILVDFKLEFGLYKKQLTLGDEISPDSSRLWDQKTLNKMDKDRFRQSLGNVIETYHEVFRRICK